MPNEFDRYDPKQAELTYDLQGYLNSRNSKPMAALAIPAIAAIEGVAEAAAIGGTAAATAASSAPVMASAFSGFAGGASLAIGSAASGIATGAYSLAAQAQRTDMDFKNLAFAREQWMKDWGAASTAGLYSPAQFGNSNDSMMGQLKSNGKTIYQQRAPIGSFRNA